MPVLAAARTLDVLVRSRVTTSPDATAFTILRDDGLPGRTLTNADLGRLVAGLASQLGDVRGERVVLLPPPGIDYVVALLAVLEAGAVAVPVMPPDARDPAGGLQHLAAVVQDCGARTTVAAPEQVAALSALSAQVPAARGMRVVAVPDDCPSASLPEGLPEGLPEEVEPRDPSAVAVVQYTSGSTGRPKGVALSHANLLHNSGLIHRLFRTDADTRGLVWLPPYHDMGLIGGILQPLYAGFPMTLMSPVHFLQDPLRWLRAITSTGATASGGPDFAYELCARRLEVAAPETVADVDLSRWAVAFDGAEPIRASTLRRFTDACAPHGFDAEAFLPCYGLAEATLIVAGSFDRGTGPSVLTVERGALDRHRVVASTDPVAGVELVSCGQPLQDVLVVDPGSRLPTATDEVGEIWVRGPSVALGYGPGSGDVVPFDARTSAGDGPYLSTGDLGFLTGSGELVVTGRVKDVLVVRGRNIYAHDVERSAESASALLRPGCTAAFQVGPGDLPGPHPDAEDGGQLVVVVAELRPGADPVEMTSLVRFAIARDLALTIDRLVLTAPGSVPRTSSGKVRRSRCRAAWVRGELDEVAATPGAPTAHPDARTAEARPDPVVVDVESTLRACLAELPATAGPDLDTTTPMLALGVDSLAIVRLGHVVEGAYGVSLPLSDLMEGASLRDVARVVAARRSDAAASPDETPDPGHGRVPLLPSQQWMWTVQQFDPDATEYVVSAALSTADPVDVAALARALDRLTERHPALGTTFVLGEDGPEQVVDPRSRPTVESHPPRSGAEDPQELVDRVRGLAERPFDLETGPLLRLDVLPGPADTVLVVSAHHAIVDLWSVAVLVRHLGHLYGQERAAGPDPGHLVDRAEPAEQAPGRDVVKDPSFAGYVRRQHRLLDDPTGDDLAAWWDAQIDPDQPSMSLPVPEGDAPAGSVFFSLEEDLLTRVAVRARGLGVTVNAVLLDAFVGMLHELSGQEVLSVATTMAGRPGPQYAETVGLFMNSVLVRSEHDPASSVEESARRTHRSVVAAMDHQDYPMMLLVQRHQRARRGRYLFDAMFTYARAPHAQDLATLVAVGMPDASADLGPFSVRAVPHRTPGGPVPVEMVLGPYGSTVRGVLHHRAGSFSPDGARRALDRFLERLEATAG